MIRDALWLIILILLMGFVHELKLNGGLREQVRLLKQVRKVENEMCAGTYQVNALCERTVREFMHRLGVAPEDYSALSQAIIRRAQTPSVVIVHEDPNNSDGVGGGDDHE